MKNVFEINVTTETENYDRFIIKKLPPELERKQNEMEETLSAIQKNTDGPLWLTIILYVAAAAAAACAVGFFDAAIDIGFAAAYNNSGWVVYVGGVCLVSAAALFLYKWFKKRKTEQSFAVQNKLAESKKLDLQCLEELKVPADADDIDIFTALVKTKKGAAKPAVPLFQYVNTPCKIYKDSINLYIANTSAVYAFPINSFIKIEARNKRASFAGWNKQEAHNKGFYKQFKVTCNSNGTFFIKPSHSVQFFAFNEEYEIIIPRYELQTLLKYVNLNVTK